MIWPLPISLRCHFLPSPPYLTDEELKRRLGNLFHRLLLTSDSVRIRTRDVWNHSPCLFIGYIFSLNIIDKHITIRNILHKTQH